MNNNRTKKRAWTSEKGRGGGGGKGEFIESDHFPAIVRKDGWVWRREIVTAMIDQVGDETPFS